MWVNFMSWSSNTIVPLQKVLLGRYRNLSRDFFLCLWKLWRNSNKFSIMSISWDRMKHDDDAKRVPYQYSTRYILIAWKTYFILCLSNNCSIFLVRTITSFVFSNSELHLQLPNFIYFNLPCCIQSVSTPIQEMAL